MLTVRIILGNIKKGQSAMSVKDILSRLEQSYQKIKDKIQITGCKSESTKCLVYLTCQSETTQNIKYDIIYELHTVDKLNLDTKFKVFSNSPSFAYNFSYIFYKLGSLLWPEKYPKEFRELAPKTRNPFYFIGFDKQIYSTIKYISEYKISRIISEFNGTIPPVKTFLEKEQEIRDIKEELKRSIE